MKIIIVGAGKVGSALAEQLSGEKNNLTILDKDKDLLDEVSEKYDVMAIEGNGASMIALEEAGVESADLVIAVTGQDEVNLLCCMTAHAVNEDIQTIARVRNPEYYSNIKNMSAKFGLSLAVNPERATAKEVERLIRYPGFLHRDTFAKNRIEIVELKVAKDSLLIGTKLYELTSKIKSNVLVCAVVRGGKVTIPSGDFSPEEADRLFVTGEPEELGRMLKSLGIITKKSKKILILGGSRLAEYLAMRLCQDGVYVQIIELNEDRCIELAEALPDAVVVKGDVSNRELLENEGVEDFDTVVSCTGLDELNVVISMYCNSLGVSQIITKLGRGTKNVSMLDTLPIGSVICPKDICSETIVRYVRAMYNGTGAAVSVHSIADGNAEAGEFVITEKDKNLGKKLKDIKLKKNILIASIVSEGKIKIPDGDSEYNAGDSVVVLSCGNTVINKFNDIFDS